MTTHLPQTNNPDDGDVARRNAVACAMGQAPALIRFALRYSSSLSDAEDAYQRAMEIALTKGPQVSEREFLSWLYVVIKHEALAIRDANRREEPRGDDEIIALAGAAAPRGAGDPHTVYAWRERYRTIQDALSGLTTSQRACLMLRSAGASRNEIEEITGFSTRKVERSIIEGRRRLREFEVRIDSGAQCGSMAELMVRVLDADATAAERRRLSLHVRHCGACRAEFRGRRDQTRLLSSLVPGALVITSTPVAVSSDPSVALNWWDRVVQGTNFRAGQAAQMWLDLPGLLATKLGAGAVAVAVAGAIGTPMVVQAVRPDPGASRVAPVAAGAQPGGASTSVAAPPAASTVRTASTSAAKTVKKAAAVPVVRKKAAPRGTSTPVVASRSVPTAPAATSGARRSSGVSSGGTRGSAEMEFSP